MKVEMVIYCWLVLLVMLFVTWFIDSVDDLMKF